MAAESEPLFACAKHAFSGKNNDEVSKVQTASFQIVVSSCHSTSVTSSRSHNRSKAGGGRAHSMVSRDRCSREDYGIPGETGWFPAAYVQIVTEHGEKDTVERRVTIGSCQINCCDRARIPDRAERQRRVRSAPMVRTNFVQMLKKLHGEAGVEFSKLRKT